MTVADRGRDKVAAGRRTRAWAARGLAIGALTALCAGFPATGLAMEAPHCGDEGVWIQILGSGGY